jgi:DNA-binding winged helix-turn-helix (wHTH) protein/Tfp pilus assembly protein PilF
MTAAVAARYILSHKGTSRGRQLHYEFSDFRFDPERGLTGPNGHIRLRKLEHRLLTTLLEADGRLLSKNAIVDAVWKGFAVSDDSIAQSVRRLRIALADAEASIVRTVYAAGLRLAVPIRRRESSGSPLLAPRGSNRSDAESWLVSARELSALRTAASLKGACDATVRALEVDPDYVAAWCALAEIHMMMAIRCVEAPKEGAAAGLAAADEALALDPECAPALGVRGFVHAVIERDVARGLADLDRSVRIDPRYWTTRLMRGWALVAANRVADAVAEVRTALDVNPWTTWCHGILTQYLWYNGEAEAALSFARDAARSLPTVDTIPLALSQVASWLGHHEEAIAAGRRARDLAPDTPHQHTSLASALAWAGRYDEALEVIHAIEAAGPPLSAVWLAVAWLGLGKRERALEMLALSREQGSAQYVYMFHDPRLASLRPEMARLWLAA